MATSNTTEIDNNGANANLIDFVSSETTSTISYSDGSRIDVHERSLDSIHDETIGSEKKSSSAVDDINDIKIWNDEDKVESQRLRTLLFRVLPPTCNASHQLNISSMLNMYKKNIEKLHTGDFIEAGTALLSYPLEESRKPNARDPAEFDVHYSGRVHNETIDAMYVNMVHRYVRHETCSPFIADAAVNATKNSSLFT